LRGGEPRTGPVGTAASRIAAIRPLRIAAIRPLRIAATRPLRIAGTRPEPPPSGPEPGCFGFDQLLRVPQLGQYLSHLDRVRGARRPAVPFDKKTHPREEGTPVVGVQVGAGRDRHPVEVVADELLRGGAHAPIIPL
jgi:hypothetical protein